MLISQQYFAVREAMPRIYYEDRDLFGPTWSASLPLNFTESSRELQNKMKKEFKTQKRFDAQREKQVKEKKQWK